MYQKPESGSGGRHTTARGISDLEGETRVPLFSFFSRDAHPEERAWARDRKAAGRPAAPSDHDGYAVHANQADYNLHTQDAYEAQLSTPTDRLNSTGAPRRRSAGLAVGLCMALVVVGVVTLLRSELSLRPVSPSVSRPAPSSVIPVEEDVPEWNVDNDLSDLPWAGDVFYENGDFRYAPLDITLAGDAHCLYLLRDWETGDLVMAFFLPAGEWVEMEVPVGDFQLSYAYGTDWIDGDQLFGPDTRYARMDERFDFYEEGDSVVGWTIEMEGDPDTDDTTYPITADEFWSDLAPLEGL